MHVATIIIIVEYSLTFIMCMLYVNVLFNFCSYSYIMSFLRGRKCSVECHYVIIMSSYCALRMLD